MDLNTGLPVINALLVFLMTGLKISLKKMNTSLVTMIVECRLEQIENKQYMPKVTTTYSTGTETTHAN